MAETIKPELFYKQQIDELIIKLNNLLKHKQLLGWTRFGILAATALLIWLFSSYGIFVSTVIFFIGLTIFLLVVRKDLANKDSINHHERLITINGVYLRNCVQYSYKSNKRKQGTNVFPFN